MLPEHGRSSGWTPGGIVGIQATTSCYLLIGSVLHVGAWQHMYLTTKVKGTRAAKYRKPQSRLGAPCQGGRRKKPDL